MYIVLYKFQIKPELRHDFIKGWKGLTELIYKHEGSLGSRLHQSCEHHYIAYAQWPSKTIFENSGNKLPVEASKYRDIMKNACERIEIVEKLELIEDLLK